MSSIPAIVADGLTKRFGEFVAVDNVSFEVPERQFFGLLGPNGAGKTTTIRMLTGVLRPEVGRVSIMGVDMDGDPLRAKSSLGVIPEIGNVYLDLSARENLEMFGRFYGLSRRARAEKASALLEELGLGDRADERIKRFSKGMKQRVSIGCAIIHEPRVIFLDEPTEGLDVHSRRMIVEKVRQMNRAGSTVVLTTHNIEEANQLCDRVCIVNKGKIVALDTPDHLRSTFEGARSVEVTFDRPVECSLFFDQCISKVEEKGNRMRFYTSDPDEAIRKVMAVRDEKGLTIMALNTLAPSLEDVFVKLTEASR
ncbi:MAG: Trehalose/maltose import ATP-binding protein MalK [Methanomassiliicoccales archaeon PtaB.Bin215]|nr:MAG: Trehalose/maltose import ATP-binding protein MalK [Methanomassiliicoccales archaeon PtaB.Bin215]